MTDTEESVPRLTADELRELFLFESLDSDQLDWLSATGRVEQRVRGDFVYREGERATCFFVLLAGTISMHRRVENTDVEISRTSQLGAYSGATQAFMAGEDAVYLNSLVAITDSRFWVIDAADIGERIRAWFPMAMHLLEGLTIGMRSSQAAVGAARTPPVAGPVVGRADPRAQQPGGRRRSGHGFAARAGQPDAGQARPPGVRQGRCHRPADPGGGAGGRRGADGQGAGDDDDGGQRPRGHHRGLARRPPGHQQLGPGPGPGRGRGRSGLVGRRRDQGARRADLRRAALGGVRAGDRAADERDRGLDPADLHPGGRREAVLAGGSGRSAGRGGQGGADQHADHARPQAQDGLDHGREGARPPICPRSPVTPPSSTRCGPT